MDGTNGRHVHWSTRACHHRAGDVLRQLCRACSIEGTRVTFFIDILKRRPGDPRPDMMTAIAMRRETEDDIEEWDEEEEEEAEQGAPPLPWGFDVLPGQAERW